MHQQDREHEMRMMQMMCQMLNPPNNGQHIPPAIQQVPSRVFQSPTHSDVPSFSGYGPYDLNNL